MTESNAAFETSQGLPAAFRDVGSASFIDLLKGHAPELLPVNRNAAAPPLDVPHGTTVLALTYADGVMMAGDRRATAGNVIAKRDLEKVLPADEYSAIAYAGSVGIALELVRLFQTELEHYEKMERSTLSLDGKARRLGTVLRENLPMAMQGLVVVTLLAGYDIDRGVGRIFTYDPSGGPWEATGFHAEGSGSPYARGALKKLYRPDLPQRAAAEVCVQALYDAADDDSATGGPDLTRDIYPVVAGVTADGYRRLPDDEVREIVRAMVDARNTRPDGPAAPLH